jgi:hypothetical protein
MPTIDFNDPASLAALTDAARFTFANNYTEDGMTVSDGVDPPDPRLGGMGYGHYHLSYERPGVLEQELSRFFLPEDQKPPPIDPTLEPRLLQNHFGDHVIQLTYDPNQDGVLDPFRLLSVDVLRGPLNVGVRFSSGDIGVYNNLTEGFTWQFTDARNFTLTRATLEATGEIFGVDNIVFEPVTPDPVQLMANPLTLTNLPEGHLTPELHELLTLIELEITGTIRPVDNNPLVDDAFYLAVNPDVAAAGIDPLVHYDQFGWREGRDPSAQFDTEAYLEANPDVAAAGINPLTHFLQYGRFEGRHVINDGILA